MRMYCKCSSKRKKYSKKTTKQLVAVKVFFQLNNFRHLALKVCELSFESHTFCNGVNASLEKDSFASWYIDGTEAFIRYS